MPKKGRLTRKCLVCGSDFVTWECKVKNGNGKFCSRNCSAKNASLNPSPNVVNPLLERMASWKGENHPSWKGGTYITRNVYIKVWVADHPYSLQNKVLEHRLVMEKHLGRFLLPSEVVHHKDGNKKNNKIENLELINNQSDHVITHMIEKYGGKKSITGWSTIWDKCVVCGESEKRHRAFGMCIPCYKKDYRKKKKERVL